MKSSRWTLLALLTSLAVSAPSLARSPIPFPDSYRDGYVLVLWGSSYLPEAINAILDRISERTAAPHLTVPVFGCQMDKASHDVDFCGPRETANQMAELAIARGFSVSFLPIVMGRNGAWRGEFEPTDPDAWFAAYRSWILKIARDSRRLNLQELVVASEMVKLYRYSAAWKRILRDVRAEFSGPLVMTVNWGDLKQDFWDEADAIGISAYYPLSAVPTPSQEELDRAWRGLRDAILGYSKKIGRPVHLSEVGYPSASTAARQPWSNPPEAVPDAAMQAKCFEAFRRAWRGERGAVRVNVWATGDPEASDPMGFETLGRPADEVLRSFFAERQEL